MPHLNDSDTRLLAQPCGITHADGLDDIEKDKKLCATEIALTCRLNAANKLVSSVSGFGEAALDILS